MRSFFLLGFLLCAVIGASGCVEPFSANVDPPSPRPLVVDGGITSGPGPHSVTLFLAAAFEQSLDGDAQRVSDADVIIVNDSTGSQTVLREDQGGTYETREGELIGRPGHAYHVEIRLPDGREYRSTPERMPEPVSLDTLSVEWDSVTERIKVLASTNDPADTSNFYRWTARITRQRSNPEAMTPPFFCWKDVPPSRISVRSDRLVDGGRIASQTVFSIEPGLKATYLNQVDVQQRAITEEAYEFWSKVQTQIENAGDPFSPPPAPIRGNVVRVRDSTDYALGYFEVAGTAQRQTACVRQSAVEGAPRTTPIPSFGCPGQNVVFDRPAYWTCSDRRNPEEDPDGPLP